MLYNVYNQNNQLIGQVEATTITEAWEGARKMYQIDDTIVLDVRPIIKPEMIAKREDEKLRTIHNKWRELDELQIKLHFDCMSSRKWAVLNSLDAIGLELTKGYPAIGSYIDDKMETIERALKDLKFDKEVDERY